MSNPSLPIDGSLHPVLEDEAAQDHASGVRRRLLGVAVGALVVLVLAVTPPLVNMKRYQPRIAANMSASLGRPVHLDGVKMHLLPVPGLTLTNLVVSEDPAFGAEPTIRANSVEVTLRVASLWGRRVEFSRIHFDDPSLNLVRNAEGRWNLQGLLMHAADVPAAPTGQRKASDAPRFPYIEATGARVNLKLGDEKMPFALTDAEFALWLPTEQQWHLRLEATPERTDSRISDTGTVRVEGTLERAALAADVPVDLAASWHDAPLGDATRLITGNDAGWRGTVHLDAALKGTLGDAQLTAKMTLDDLRRADFVPPQMLDVSLRCTAEAVATAMTLRDVVCALPVDDGDLSKAVTVRAGAMDLQRPLATPLAVDAEAVPLPWVFGWLRLVSARIPAEANPAGTVTAHVQRTGPHVWQGRTAAEVARDETPVTFAGTLAADGGMCPVALQVGTTAVQGGSVTGSLTQCGYSFRLDGPWSASLLAGVASDLPQLAAGLDLPENGTAHLDVGCTSSWGGEQTCVAQKTVAVVKRMGRRKR
jgi:hypothetical protein